MVIVFDLDDTLFDSFTYVYSGFRAVADYLSPLLQLPTNQIFQELKATLAIDRHQVFDHFLAKKGYKTSYLIQQCLRIYRTHEPVLHLFPEAKACLKRLKGHALYVVTDGNKRVQKRKCLALNLFTYVRQCLCTHAYGLNHAKPSPYCFQLICQKEHVSPSDVIYVGDNPYKDFIELKPLGFHTIRVLTGPYKETTLAASYEAELTISSLNDLNKGLLKMLLNNG